MMIKMLNINRKDRINFARMDRELIGNNIYDRIIRSDICFII